MTIYALSISAVHNDSGRIANKAAASKGAGSKKGAVEFGLKMARHQFPAELWHDHGCVTCAIPADWLPDAARIRALEDQVSALRQQLDDLGVAWTARPITTEAEYRAALAEAAPLMGAEAGTADERELSALADAIEEYEKQNRGEGRDVT